MYVDGGVLGKNPSPKGVYWSLRVEGWEPRPFVARRSSHDWHSNNDAEWLAVREALYYAAAAKINQPIVIYSDSRLVVNQFNGKWKAALTRHILLKSECQTIAAGLKFVVLKWTPRETMVEKLGH